MHPSQLGRYIPGSMSPRHAPTPTIAGPWARAWQLHSFRPAASTPLRDRAYALWRRIWSEVFSELSGVFDDAAFDRADEVIVLCRGAEPVALSLIQRLDLREAQDRAHPHFAAYSPALFDELVARGDCEVLVGRYFTVDPAYRRDRSSGPATKDLLFGAIAAHFVASDADLMLGCMRDNRGMQRLGERFGGEPLHPGVIHHGFTTTLQQFTRARVSAALRSEVHPTEARALWQAWQPGSAALTRAA